MARPHISALSCCPSSLGGTPTEIEIGTEKVSEWQWVEKLFRTHTRMEAENKRKKKKKTKKRDGKKPERKIRRQLLAAPEGFL